MVRSRFVRLWLGGGWAGGEEGGGAALETVHFASSTSRRGGQHSGTAFLMSDVRRANYHVRCCGAAATRGKVRGALNTLSPFRGG